MKKLLCTFLILLLTLSMFACNAGNGTETSGTPSGTSEPSGTFGTDDTSGDDTPAETLVKVADTETPWYIEEWETARPLTEPEFPGKSPVFALHVPLTYEAEKNGVALSVEFFQEYYLIGDPLQVKLTITNQTGETLRVHSNGASFGIWRDPNDNFQYFDIAWMQYPNDHTLEHYTVNYYSSTNVRHIEILPGESLVLEHMYIVEAGMLFDSATYVYRVDLNSAQSDGSSLDFDIPIAVAEIELISEGAD